MIYESELFHHGVPGQKWGVRRYQNKDGTWKKSAVNAATKYRNKELQKSDTRYKRTLEKSSRIIEKTKEKNKKLSPKKASKILSSVRTASARHKVDTAVLNNMGVDELLKERNTARVKTAAAWITTVGTTALAVSKVTPAIPIGNIRVRPAVYMPSGSETYKAKNRINLYKTGNY